MGVKSKEPWFGVRIQENSPTAVGCIDDLDIRSPVIPQIGDTFLWPPREIYRPEGPHFETQAFKVVDRIIVGSIESPGIMRVHVIVEPVEIDEWKMELA